MVGGFLHPCCTYVVRGRKRQGPVKNTDRLELEIADPIIRFRETAAVVRERSHPKFQSNGSDATAPSLRREAVRSYGELLPRSLVTARAIWTDQSAKPAAETAACGALRSSKLPTTTSRT